MNRTPSVDEQRFRKLLGRNVGLPLGVGVLSAVFFILLISYLLNAIQWVEHTDRVINNTNRSMKLSIDMETGMRGFLLTGDQHFLDPYEIAKPLLVAELNGLQDLVQDNPTQQDRFRRLFTMQQEWNAFAQEMIDLRRNNGDFQTPVLAGRGKRITDQIRTEYEQAVEMEQQLRLTRNAEVTRSTVISVTLYLIFVIVVSGILAYIGRRDLLSLSATYSANLRLQEVNAERLQKVAWLRNGQSELAEQVLGQLTLNMLGRNILQFLTQYLGALVAAVYIRQDHGGFTRVASYGFSREQEQQDQTIHSDEGVVGQAASQDRIITLDELPENYFKVASGLGEGSPRSVVVVPISNDDQVNGVVELGFLRPLTEQDVEFLELVSDNIGTSIEAARYRQRLQEVLAETQQLNEELQVQQEELRTANEELEEQSRILKESQAHLETQQAELEQTNEQLAEQSQALADQRTDFTARVELSGLPVDQAIFYRVSFEDAQTGVASEPWFGHLRSTPQQRRDIRFVWSGDTVGQGFGINPDIGGMRIYEAMRLRLPDFFIHSGDTIYADGPVPAQITAEGGRIWRNITTEAKSKVAETLDEYRGNYRYNLMDENLRRFNAECRRSGSGTTTKSPTTGRPASSWMIATRSRTSNYCHRVPVRRIWSTRRCACKRRTRAGASIARFRTADA
ncbi:GAF domain-containing protein [Pseudomonas syringae pv. actinidiae]|nr:GAF domain-containing protein [Pseudomonas syringae pv. actinidiae]